MSILSFLKSIFSPHPLHVEPYLYKRIGEGLIPDPFINLNVTTPNYGDLNLKFLVDSGADVTILPLNPYADLFSFDHKQAKPVKIKGIARTVNAYPHQLSFKINGKTYETRCYFVEAKTIPLLGRLDIWDQFNLYFNNSQNQLELTKTNKS